MKFFPECLWGGSIYKIIESGQNSGSSQVGFLLESVGAGAGLVAPLSAFGHFFVIGLLFRAATGWVVFKKANLWNSLGILV